MSVINTYEFNNKISEKLRSQKYGTNWPVVYIINNDKEAYIGETTDVSIRSNQHLANEVRKKLKKINVIADDTFNKSSILDLESFLIKHMAADNKYKLQNGNGGLQNHNYYQKEMYERKFSEIWLQLKSKGLVARELHEIENSDLFKYSPYKSLTTEQYAIVNQILADLSKAIENNENARFIVNGGAGTGKTILGIYIIKLLQEAHEGNFIFEEDTVDESIEKIANQFKELKNIKIGLVIPMANLRKTLKNVFKNIKGLSSKMVLSPNDVAKSEEIYDLLVVDEAHRLRRRKNLTQYESFDNNNKKFGLDYNGTELDWILNKSKHQIFFYDMDQTIKPTDIRKEQFLKLFDDKNTHLYTLETQMRCLKGGNEYVDYIKSVFSNEPPKDKRLFKDYELKIFNNIEDLINVIEQKNNEVGLSRVVAGYAWKWNSKGKKLPLHISDNNTKKITSSGIYDIEIEGHKFIWNSRAVDWINSPNSINEIGSIHTTQGFDLNYTGLIIGNDLKYDDENHILIADKNNYYDSKGKNNTTNDELLRYLLNIYSVMATRGMLGTYIYVCDEKLRKYLKKYIEEYK